LDHFLARFFAAGFAFFAVAVFFTVAAFLVAGRLALAVAFPAAARVVFFAAAVRVVAVRLAAGRLAVLLDAVLDFALLDRVLVDRALVDLVVVRAAAVLDAADLVAADLVLLAAAFGFAAGFAAGLVAGLAVAAGIAPTRGSFRVPSTTSLNSVPGRKLGTVVRLSRNAWPVRGLRAVRAARTRFSNTPKPVRVTFSPWLTLRTMMSNMPSTAAAAAFLSMPSRRPSISISCPLFMCCLPVRDGFPAR
jgi:hypothetical protein